MFCTAPCDEAQDITCPMGLLCLQGICHNPPPSPGELGSRCLFDDDCVDALCLARDGDDDTRCTRRCFSDLPGFDCPSGTACEPASDDGEACFRERDAGCCSGSRSSPSSLSGALALLEQIGSEHEPAL